MNDCIVTQIYIFTNKAKLLALQDISLVVRRNTKEVRPVIPTNQKRASLFFIDFLNIYYFT